jgi:hypothetical protein
MSETSSNCWKFSVINEASCSEYLVSDYRLLACIRHSTVHNDGEPSELTCGGLQKNERAFIESIMLKSIVIGKRIILPSVTVAEHMFDSVSGFAYALYWIASKECDMAIKVFK